MKDKKTKTRHEIYDSFVETMESSTIHGFANIIKNPLIPIKVMWALCIVGSIGYCGYSIYTCLYQYYLHEVVTQVEIKYENQLAFPMVKICRDDLSLPYRNSNLSDKLSILIDLTFQRTLLKTNTLNSRKNIGIQDLSDVLITCVYNLITCNITTDFEYFYDWGYGSCYQFNSGRNMLGKPMPIKTISITGPSNGLQVELYTPKTSENNNYLAIENSYNILISNEPMDSSAREGLRLPSGMSTNIVLDKYSIEQVPKPYSECTADLTTLDAYKSECYRITLLGALNQSRSYHFSDCKNTCLQKLIGDSCKCQQTAYYPFYSNMRKCIETTDVSCLYSALNKFTTYSSIIKECDCPLECHIIDYSLRSSVSQYPTKYYSKVLLTNPVIQSKFKNPLNTSFVDLQSSLVSFNIYYDQLQMMEITHDIKMIANDLMANIGGNMGLFLGMSLLTHIEMVEIIFQTLIIAYKTKIRDKSKAKRDIMVQPFSQVGKSNDLNVKVIE